MAAATWRGALGAALAAMAVGAICTAASWDGTAELAAMAAWVLLLAGAVGGLAAGTGRAHPAADGHDAAR